MHTDPTVTEVFEEVEPDPDAILGEVSADSPEAVLEGAGDHDPEPDDAVDADDVTAAEVFADLKAVSLEVADADATDEPTAGATATTPHRQLEFGTSADDAGDWELIGPGPAETRIENDAFGGVGLEPTGDATAEFAWFEA